jgi:hypothetical protein
MIFADSVAARDRTEAIALFVRSKAPGTVRIGIETGPTTTWLWTELKRLGLPVICIDARHAKAVLKMQINKSDRNDAAGIARIMQTGWFKEVRVKDLDSHAVISTVQEFMNHLSPHRRRRGPPRPGEWPAPRVCVDGKPKKRQQSHQFGSHLGIPGSICILSFAVSFA